MTPTTKKLNTTRFIVFFLLAGALLLAPVHSLVGREAVSDDRGRAPFFGSIPQASLPVDLTTVSGNESAHHVIREAGAYYLSADLEVTKPTGINIQSAGVTLDLNGFAIRRVSDSGGHGVLIAITADECVVGNGSISGFGYGVRAFSEGGVYHQLTASDCSLAGLVGGARWLISDCRAHNNGETDILTGDGSTIQTWARARAEFGNSLSRPMNLAPARRLKRPPGVNL